MIVAVDISKAKNCVRFRSPEGIDSRPYEFSNTRVGFDKFYSHMRWYKNYYHTPRIVVGLESTGVYGKPLIHYLESKNIRLVLVNPVHTKRVKEIRDNSPNKTDQKDPRVIADIIQLGCTLSVIVPKGYAAELRQLIHARERAIGNRNGLLNQLHALVYTIFPEFFQVIKSLKSKTAHYLLKTYPTPGDIAALRVDELANTIRSISRGRITRPKVEKLHKFAKTSIGIQEGRNAIVYEITHLVEQLCSHELFIKNIKEDIAEILRKISYSQRIMSIKGIAEITTAGLLGETACFHDMKSSREVEKLAGLNLFEISSGKHQGQRRISKRGRSLLRKLLYFAALNVIKSDGVFRDKYQSYLKKGKPKKQALVAISRKLIRVVFALVRDDINFDTNYTQEHHFAKAA